MPTINHVRLIIQPGLPGKSNVTVHTQIKFSATEIGKMKKHQASYRIGCKLFAQDSSDLPTGPDLEISSVHLGWLSYPATGVSPVALVNHSYIKLNVANFVLNEDSPSLAVDEIFARVDVILTSTGANVASKKSNVVSQTF